MSGSNAPVIDLPSALDPRQLEPWVDFQYAQHASAIETLMVRHGRFLQITEGGISDDIMLGHASDFAKLLRAADVDLNNTRTNIKKPVLHAQRLIDGKAKALADQITMALTDIELRSKVWLKKKEDANREAARLEALRLAAEAERLIAEAQQSGTKEDAETAWNTMDEADAAQKLAEAKALELTRTRSQGGSLTGLRDNYVHKLVDITKVPMAYLQVNDALVKAAIKSGVRQIEGLEIYNDPKVMVR